MAMNATKVTLNVHGVNKTGKVFKQIAASAAGVAKIGALAIGGSFAAAAVAFAATAKSLGQLSDVAMQAGVSADEITKLSTAMNILGIKSNTPEQLATAFQKMGKSIGETGVGGFKRAIGAIAQLSTLEERSAAAMAVFGKTGLDFMPLIEAAAKGGVDSLEKVVEGMPSISQAAADAGDSVADAMVLITQGTKDLWSEAIGSVCAVLDKQFTGGVREAAMKANAYMKYFALGGIRYVSTWYTSWSESVGGIQEGVRVMFMNLLKMSGMFVQAFFESVAAPLRKGIEWIVDRWVGGWIRITQGYDAAVNYARIVESNEKSISEMAMEPWKNLAEEVRSLQWFPTGTEVNLDDLKKNLEEELKKAEEAAAAVSKAAVSTAASDAADDTAAKVQDAVKKAKQEFIGGETYKAATMSIRADYGKGDKSVKAVDRVRSVVEKLNGTAAKISAAMTNLGVAG